ncbi:MAG TPA: sigma-70 family RNA polymerase sigma factor [Aggregatilineaceae bacterium]|nr:sigma-70 family RNA polymerase sigma factor [Aggregatilineaceae bacterium]
MSQENDSLWVAQTLAGDQQAFGELVHRYERDVFNLSYRMLNDRGEAEDAAQEAFLRAYANLDRYDPERPFKTWVLSIASNHCIDRIRRRRLTWLSLEEPLPPHPALTSDLPGPEEAALTNERNQVVQELLGQLPADYRMAVVLRYWYDLSYAEIADMLNTTESAIKSRLFRARQALADQLEAKPVPFLNPAMEGSS